MKKWLACVAAVSLAMVGCGGDSTCDDLADANDSVVEQAAACRNVIDDSYFEKSTDDERDQCKDALEECSDSDKDALKDVAKCLNDLPKCSANDPVPFETAFDACFAPLATKVSRACAASISASSLKVPANFSRAR
ncbi:hypothetical protein [Stigmatella aurantiaca]|uniref:Lipoprotein n=1 Tax=Stigmatella aurantiaca (strain DW4/3-1) TaxID=378806 RepID=E3FDJ5_STIAD|nr:hypothetical protein [Stigmatella aurantiaca]ADO70074.1 uncharacterized protein STAUR_2270 [Stigmatella aurantiaca DW4/3-1]